MTKFTNTASALAIATAALIGISASASADIVHLDDVIVDGSICVGQDCVNGESFGFDTIRIKENNLRIRAVDTSNSASFPTRDWQITFNDSSNGGANKFSIDDIDGGRTPFTIEGNAPSHSLYVDDGGRLGLGTNTPVADIHVKSGNTPTMRLEQDGSSGFTPQTWDVAGNEAGFFIRDATNGSTLPLRILPGAPSAALVVTADGDVGVGVMAPDGDADLQISRSDGVIIKLDDNTPSTGIPWNIQSIGGEFRITTPPGGSAEKEFVLDADGNLTINGTITTSASCSVGCDRVFDEDYHRLSIRDHADLMWANRYLPAVGATDETGPMNLSDKIGGMLNELEQAHIYIEQLNARLDALEAID
jgi:hypothetical protein